MDVLGDIAAFFSGFSAETLKFIKGAAMVFESSPQLQSIATAAVTKAEDLAVSGLEKQAAAKSDVLGQLASAGLPVVESQVNLAIETAVANLAKPAAAAAPAPAAAPAADDAPAGATDAPSAVEAPAASTSEG